LLTPFAINLFVLLKAELDRVVAEALPAQVQSEAADVAASPTTAEALSRALAIFSLAGQVVLDILRILAGLLSDLFEDLVVM
jgi:hypothetical protein